MASFKALTLGALSPPFSTDAWIVSLLILPFDLVELVGMFQMNL
jgi:hypothetical protein